MNYRLLILLACILLTACNSAAKKEAETNAGTDKTAETETEKLNLAESLKSEFEVAFMDDIKRAGPRERSDLAESNPKDCFADQFRILAENYGDSEVEATALAWLASNSDKAEERTSSLATLMETHPDSPAMKEAALAIVATGKPSQSAEDHLRRIMYNSSHREARGAAAYHLVNYLVRYKPLGERADELEENESAFNQLGEEGLAYLRNLRVSDVEIERLYETIANDYSDVVVFQFGRKVNIGDAVKNALFEIKRLSLGCIAPDIEGSDLDGKEFALSDYRGKVVMLDFWGNW